MKDLVALNFNELKWRIHVHTALLKQARINAELIVALRQSLVDDDSRKEIIESVDKSFDELMTAIQDAIDLTEEQIKAFEND